MMKKVEGTAEEADKEIRDAENHLTSNDCYLANASQLLSFDFYCIDGGGGTCGTYSQAGIFFSSFILFAVDSKLFGELVKERCICFAALTTHSYQYSH